MPGVDLTAAPSSAPPPRSSSAGDWAGNPRLAQTDRTGPPFAPIDDPFAPSPDDQDAEDAGLIGAPLILRELGGEVISDTTTAPKPPGSA
jgi:hypothetical protein